MSAAKHTPGPWTVHIEPVLSKPLAALKLSKLVDGTKEFSGVLPMVVGANGLCTAITGCGPDGMVNAHLIAAAPDLLEALADIAMKAELAANACDDDGRAAGFRILAERARAAIARATGSAS